MLYLKFSRNEIDSDLDLATISDKSDSDRVIILLATMDDIDWIPPILLTEARDSKKSASLLISLILAFYRGSKGSDLRIVKTLFS